MVDCELSSERAYWEGFRASLKPGCRWWLVHQCSRARVLGTGGRATSGTRRELEWHGLVLQAVGGRIDE